MSTASDAASDILRSAVGRLLAAERRLRGRDQHRGSGALNYAHLRALFILMQEDEATAGSLAKAAELNPASVTAMIDQLESHGLVRRRRDDHDRRQCWVSLTDAGRSQVQEKERVWRAKMAVALSDITDDEVAVAAKVLDRIAAVMEGLGEESAANKA
jgi:MarR family transcriptional regulator, organic hydroperoxide resistance regulator